MILAIVGSRGFTDYVKFCNVLNTIQKTHDIEEVVSGGATGADSLAARWSKENNIKFTCFPAKWHEYGMKAGYMRNKDIVQYCDKLLAFWDGASKGTNHTINRCKKFKKKHAVCYY
jgi:hypothetical protein